MDDVGAYAAFHDRMGDAIGVGRWVDLAVANPEPIQIAECDSTRLLPGGGCGREQSACRAGVEPRRLCE